MQQTENFRDVNIETFHQKNFDTFNMFAQNIDCGYTLEPPQQSQSMFWIKNKNQRTNGPENAHLKPDFGVLSHYEMTLTLNTHTPLLTS